MDANALREPALLFVPRYGRHVAHIVMFSVSNSNPTHHRGNRWTCVGSSVYTKNMHKACVRACVRAVDARFSQVPLHAYTLSCVCVSVYSAPDAEAVGGRGEKANREIQSICP